MEEILIKLKDGLLEYATNGINSIRSEDYVIYRKEIISREELKKLAPSWLIECTSLKEFRSFIKKYISTYQGRREFLRKEFARLFDYIESQQLELNDQVPTVLKKLDSEYIREVCDKAINRKNQILKVLLQLQEHCLKQYAKRFYMI